MNELSKEWLDKIEKLTNEVFYMAKPDIKVALTAWTKEVLESKLKEESKKE